MSSIYDTLDMRVTNFNIVVATLGGFLSLFGLVSYLLKEKFYLGEALISTVAGVIFSPHATNLLKPLEYASGDELTLDSITLYFSRLVLGVQLVLAGIQLPSRYLKKEWKSLSLLLGPGMCFMWLATSLLVWGLVPHISFLHALAVAACVTPTDPVLSNSIVKGRFADKNIPRELQRIIIAESGANDGLGYPFLLLPLYLIQFTGEGGAGQTGGAAKAMGYWFGITWGYVIIMSVLYGALVGWLFKEALHWAEERKYVDRESFLIFAITLALFIVGTVGMLGSDDVLACFIAGNTFTWDDWFRLETMDDSFQPTIDLLLNVAIFVWFGAICPWHMFVANDVIPIYRLIPLGILILLLRRPPIVLAMHTKIHQIEEWRQALFVGYFGPIGVSAIFYLYTARDILEGFTVNGVQREDARVLEEVLTVFVWFMTIVSIVAHGLSIPLGKVGWYLPRTLSSLGSRSMSRNSSDGGGSDAAFHVNRGNASSIEVGATQDRPHQIFRIGRAVIRNPRSLTKSRERSEPTSGTQTPKERTAGNGEELRNDPPPNPRIDEGERTPDRRFVEQNGQDSPRAEDGQSTPPHDEDIGPDTPQHPSALPASPGPANRSVTFATLSGVRDSSYTKGRRGNKKDDKSNRKVNREPIQKQDIRILGARPMGRNSVSAGAGATMEMEGSGENDHAGGRAMSSEDRS